MFNSVGDLLDACLALHFISICCRIDDLSTQVKLRMFLNVVFDFLLGLLPVLGDILDVLFRANIRNAALFEHYYLNRELMHSNA